MSRIIIVGAGGFGREVALYLRESYPDTPIHGFLDDNPHALDGHDTSVPLVGKVKGWRPGQDDLVVLGVGTPGARRDLATRLSGLNAQFLTLIHPRALVAPNAVLGNGVIVGPFAYVSPEARLGDHVVLNVYASAGHDTSVGAFCVLSPYVTLHGNSIVEDEVFLGSHSIVTREKRVGARARIGASSVVYTDVPSGRLALGNPARIVPLPPEE
jgi:sugar O-acyltransferase (sialic acid O-acetyltransferase NeuD family)